MSSAVSTRRLALLSLVLLPPLCAAPALAAGATSRAGSTPAGPTPAGPTPAGPTPAGTAAGAAAPGSTTPAATFTSTTLGGTSATISNAGNIIDYLSPDSDRSGHYEHIGVGALGEGYVLCYTGAAGTVNAYDTGSATAGFGASTVVSKTSTSLTVKRNTKDGRLTLTQVVTFVPEERAVQIKMTVKNNTMSPVKNVVLRRQVDFDVDTGGTDGWAGFSNWFAATTRTSVFAFNDASAAPADKEAHAMEMSFLGKNLGSQQTTFVTKDILDHTCGADSRLTSGTPAFGDYGGTMVFPLDIITAGASQFGSVEYKRF